MDLQSDDGQAQARLGGLRFARFCRPTASIRDKSDTVSFAKNAISKELGENRFKQLIKKVGEEKAMAMLEKSEGLFPDRAGELLKASSYS